MPKQLLSSKKFIFSTFILLVGLFLFINHSLLAQTLPVGSVGTANDFDNDLRLGVQNLAVNPAAQIQQKEIQNQDYKSTWDEFGTNVLIDGDTTPDKVIRKITQDIIQAVETEKGYDLEEASYLENIHLAPEEVQSIEGPAGSDVPPTEPIIPNPSLEANPNVDVSSAENNEIIAATSITTATSTTIETTETAASKIDTAISKSETKSETNTSIIETGPANENAIFEAILKGEEAAEQTPAEENIPVPEATPPTE